jgi:hypothetical protein
VQPRRRGSALAVRLGAAVGLAAWALAGCESGDPGGPLSVAAPEGEILLASPPEDWRETRGLNRGAIRIAEFTAPSGPDANRLDQIRFESMGTLPLPDPIDFLADMSREMASACERFEDFPVHAGYENGYPSVVRLFVCHRRGDPPSGELRLVKAIQGAEQFYVIARSRRTDALGPDDPLVGPEEMAAWSRHIGAIGLCDTRGTDHPCPASVRPGSTGS